jgi:hypothetical protein
LDNPGLERAIEQFVYLRSIDVEQASKIVRPLSRLCAKRLDNSLLE